MSTPSTLTHLECSYCGAEYDANALMNLCPQCAKPLLARYDLVAAARTLTAQSLAQRPASMWRYAEVLPVQDEAAILDLGEGWTPLTRCDRLGAEIGCPDTWIKDEGLNPTGSFKARGLSAAVSRAYELGATSLAIPSAGNAAGAMSAYAAKAGLPAYVFMPADVPSMFRVECAQLGAQVTLIDGLITDCGVAVREGMAEHGWFDVSTLKEPYRIEGKKTMGYELAEQLGWTAARRDHLPHGRRHRSDRHVEGLCRDGDDGPDRAGAAAHGDGAEPGLCAHGARVRAR